MKSIDELEHRPYQVACGDEAGAIGEEKSKYLKGALIRTEATRTTSLSTFIS
jgi:hypothetical protein